MTDLNTVYLTNKDKLKVEALTWAPMGNDVRVEVFNINTGQGYGVNYSGGSITNRTISLTTIPAGDYRVFVVNISSSNVSGILQYSWV
jgi:hypothetical protein